MRRRCLSWFVILIALFSFAATGCGDTESEQKAKELLENMSLHDKVCQLFIVSADTAVSRSLYITPDEESMADYRNSPYGGVLIYGKNIVSEEQIKVLNESFSDTAVPPFIVSQQLGGISSRLALKLDGVQTLQQRRLTAQGNISRVYEAALVIGEYMNRLSFNMNLAPYADLSSSYTSAYLAADCFSSEADETAAFAYQFAEGMIENDVIPVYGHFPGIGATVNDPWRERIVINKEDDELYATDMLPFRQAIAAGMPCIMMSSARYPALDQSREACFSYTIVTGILRNEFVFDGIIITDYMNTDIIKDAYSAKESAVLAIHAGCDMILMSSNPQNAVKAIEEAVKNGDISLERIDNSVLRILKIKLEYGIIPF